MDSEKYRFILYLAGISHENQKLISRFEETLKDIFNNRYTLEVVDVLEHSAVAIDEKIFATPTLVKKHPEPVQKFIFDLSDMENTLMCLDMVKKNDK